MILRIVLYCFTLGFAISCILSHYLLKNADKFRVGKRVYLERVKLHKKGVPRLGGLALYTALYVTLLLVYIFRRNLFQNYEIKLIGIFLASTLIVGCGLYDDLIKRLSYRIKFATQLVAVIIVILCGYNVDIVTNPFNGDIYIGILGIFFVLLWMIAIMNAINIMDGLDGLVCGISIIVSLAFLAIEFYRGHIFSLLFIAPFIGVSLAFLRYNFYPAKLFLGDSGSFFIGFILGILAIESSTKRATAISLIVPLLTLFIPIVSVIFTFSRRIAYAKNPFEADRKHMHYRLLHAGISHRDTVLLYYTISFLYATLGAFCYFMPKKFELAIIAFAIVTMWWLYLWALHFTNLREKLHRQNLRTEGST